MPINSGRVCYQTTGIRVEATRDGGQGQASGGEREGVVKVVVYVGGEGGEGDGVVGVGVVVGEGGEKVMVIVVVMMIIIMMMVELTPVVIMMMVIRSAYNVRSMIRPEQKLPSPGYNPMSTLR